VICASEYLKEGLQRIHRLKSAHHIHVIPMGVDTDLFRPAPGDCEDAAVLSRFGISGPYVFGYADILGLKNVPRILDAWAQLRREGAGMPVKLVLMGDPACRSFVRRELTALGDLQSEALFPGFVSRRELAALYRGARALVFPSLTESFGLCIIEAMACGTPVLTSTVTAMPEVAGRAALLVDPLDTEQIRDGMDLLVNDSEEHARHARAGLERARDFTWDATARKTLEVYREMLCASHKGRPLL
jgi:glycosyltransferase involved in cell wall biosynthesis